MTRKAAVLFAATSVIWGSSFLFIRVAVEHLPGCVRPCSRWLSPGALWS